jgi:transcriptional regulator with XRE-family HTH domain
MDISKLTNQQIGSRIKRFRKQKKISQEDIARVLNIPRSSVAQIELGNRQLSVIELLKISDFLGFSFDTFFSNEYEKNESIQMVAEPTITITEERLSIPEVRINVLETIILYILEQCGGKPNVNESTLSKLLYFCDFNYYEVFEEHLTGATYRNLYHGPSPNEVEDLLKRMVKNGSIQRIKVTKEEVPSIRYMPLVKADLTIINGAAKSIIDHVINQFSDWSSHKILEFIKKDMPVRATGPGEAIDYELVFYRESPFSARTYDEKASMQ